MGHFHNPTPGFSSPAFSLPFLLGIRFVWNMHFLALLFGELLRRLSGIALSKLKCCCCSLGSGGSTTTASRVAANNFTSWRWAGPTSKSDHSRLGHLLPSPLVGTH